MVKVLAIDGGGIRGIIPALVLAEIEQRTGKGTAELFDLIAGTSAGGIIALGLTRPSAAGGGKPEHTAKALCRFFKEDGQRVFGRSIWRRIGSAGGWLDEKYSSKGVEKVLKEYGGGARLSEALTEVLVTSYDIEARQPYYFKRKKAREEGEDFPIWEVGRATSAAPTYFEPIKLRPEKFALIDGGVFVNNPALCALVEARKIHGESADFLVVSLGTGDHEHPIPFRKARRWGRVGWLREGRILGVVFDGVSDAADYHLGKLLPADRYYRFQIALHPSGDHVNLPTDELDDARRENIQALEKRARELIQNQSEDLEALSQQLVA